MTEIRGLIFDYGGVLWDMSWAAARALEEAHGLPERALPDTLYTTEAWRELQVGRGDRARWVADAHALLEGRAGRPLPPLHDRWRSAQGWITANIELVRALRPPYRTSILSNADATLRSRIAEADASLLDLFDDFICSAEVGMAKPDPRIFALAARRLGLLPQACIFVDDAERNVAAAREAGMQAVHYRIDRGDSLAAQLGALGVTPVR
jgi:putative hydrolase of the HAD superfamily